MLGLPMELIQSPKFDVPNALIEQFGKKTFVSSHHIQRHRLAIHCVTFSF